VTTLTTPAAGTQTLRVVVLKKKIFLKCLNKGISRRRRRAKNRVTDKNVKSLASNNCQVIDRRNYHKSR